MRLVGCDVGARVTVYGAVGLGSILADHQIFTFEGAVSEIKRQLNITSVLSR